VNGAFHLYADAHGTTVWRASRPRRECRTGNGTPTCGCTLHSRRGPA